MGIGFAHIKMARKYGVEKYGSGKYNIVSAKMSFHGRTFGAICATEEVAKAFSSGSHGSTYGGNPVTCASALAAISELLDCDMAVERIKESIEEFVYRVGRKTDADVVITEIGGTIGDIESQPFLEAVRQISLEVGRENSLFIHVTLVPYLSGSEEHKSKPTQHSVKELRGMGINPDIIVLRCDRPLEASIFQKIALFCNVKPDCCG